MAAPFQFKEFTVQQDRCAMKIGTDGVLLGAWASINHHPFSVLDIGAGTGVIALMLAQRSSAELIDAVEIEPNAYEQCVENFEQSPWNDRLFCYHASLAEFAEEIDDTYDCIISNPPFYEDTFTSPEEDRNTARFTESLPFKELLQAVSKLLSPQGNFSAIIPYKNEEEFCQLATAENLYLNKVTHVQGNKKAPVKRSLLAFSKQKSSLEQTNLVIEKDRHIYTEDYKKLVQDFYVKM
ncbi:tRNA1(Val) (adenine(37)-N6)-methyltransferase [Mesonia aquimarina]|uniref:tRNA1(Val) (adenine(37)-N6)-methyltransferase n=1 Tax=Mesonia aquimarina TaxID=1504967 RepID=UPI000EF5D130|nr:methyltransferase [Mesonia aquimarina]